MFCGTTTAVYPLTVALASVTKQQQSHPQTVQRRTLIEENDPPTLITNVPDAAEAMDVEEELRFLRSTKEVLRWLRPPTLQVGFALSLAPVVVDS